MKKIISMVIVLSMVLGIVTLPTMASAASYTFDFDTNVGSPSKAPVDYIEGNSNTTKAVYIEGGIGCTKDEHKVVGSTCWDIVPGWLPWNWSNRNKIEGETLVTFDIMVPVVDYRVSDQSMKFTIENTETNTTLETQRLMYITNRSPSEGKPYLTFLGEGGAGKFAPYINAGEWAKVAMVISPAKGTYRVSVNGEVSDLIAIAPETGGRPAIEQNAYNAFSTINFLSIFVGSKYYLDNITIGNPEAMALTSATPAAGATNVKLTDKVSFAFNNPVASADLKFNGSAVKFNIAADGKTITMADSMAHTNSAVITGTVTDICGSVYTVNHTFSTVPFYAEYLDEHVLGNYCTECSGTCWTHGLSSWRPWEFAQKPSITGDLLISFDVTVSDSTSGASRDIQAVQMELGDESGTNPAIDTKRFGYFTTNGNGGWRFVGLAGSGESNMATGFIDLGEWRTVSMLVSPAKGTCTFSADGISQTIKLQNSSNVDVVPGTYTRINTFRYINHAVGTEFKIKNLKVQTPPTSLSMTAAPASGASNVYEDENIVFTFSNPVASHTLKLNDADAVFTKSNGDTVLTLANAREYSTAYTITGTVTDVAGNTTNVNYAFTTSRRTLISTVGDKYTFDFDSTAGNKNTNAVIDVVSGDDNTSKVLQLKGYNGTCTQGCSDGICWHNYSSWNSGKVHMFGETAVSFKMQFPETFAATSMQFVTIELSTTDANTTLESNRLFHMDLVDGRWRINMAATAGSGTGGYLLDTFSPGEWVTVNMVINPTKGLYTVRIGDHAQTSYIPYRTTADFQGHLVSEYGSFCKLNFLNYATNSSIYIDDVKFEKAFAIENGHFENAEGERINTTCAAPVYKATLCNGSAYAEDVTFAMVAQNAAGDMVDLVFDTVTVPANGKLTVDKQFSVDVSDCTVKAFYVDLDTVSPFDAIDLPLLSLGLN